MNSNKIASLEDQVNRYFAKTSRRSLKLFKIFTFPLKV